MIFTFSQSNKKNWPLIAKNCEQRIKIFEAGTKDFQIEISEIKQKRSGAQLRAYWRLIAVIRAYMNGEQGNNFSEDAISSWIKIQAGHYELFEEERINDEGEQYIERIKTAKSISKKSGTTVGDMKNILEFMIKFGIDHEIQGCYISAEETEEILNNFR